MGTRPLSNAILICRMIPSVVMGIPMYIVGQRLGLQDTYFMLVIAITTFALPFQIWMLIGFYAQIPKSLDESARIDGCSFLPGVLAHRDAVRRAGALRHRDHDLLLLVERAVLRADLLRQPHQDRAAHHHGVHGYRTFDWGAILAAGVILMAPTLLVGLVFKRYMVSGLTAGAVKG